MTELDLDDGLFLYFSLFLDYAAVGVDKEEALTIEHPGGWAEHILWHTSDDLISFAFLLKFELHLPPLILLIIILLLILLILYILELYLLAVLHLLDIHRLLLFDISFVSV